MEIYDSLLRHRERERASFHMPGHKGGAMFRGSRLYNDRLELDVTELPGTDCLAHPTEAIMRSESYAARLYGAQQAFYLTCGATCGILSMIYAFFREGDSVLVDRGCHSSVWNALALCGLNPVYIAPEVDPARGVPKGFSVKNVRAALQKYPDVRGVVITSPNYYGFCSELREIALAAHEAGAVLLVDEAHGAHFPFDQSFPKGAMAQGADASVVSLHKSLPCPNQTALLLIGDSGRAKDAQSAVNIFHTTSPSYIMLCYMEEALAFAERHGHEETARLSVLLSPFAQYLTDDPFKLLIRFSDYGLTGSEAERIMREEYGIFAELCDSENVLLMASWGNDKKDFELLGEALRRLCAGRGQPEKHARGSSAALQFSEGRPALSPREVRQRETEWVPVRSAVGRIAARAVTVFPPCVPLLLPGELITAERAESVSLLAGQPQTDGIRDGRVCVVL